MGRNIVLVLRVAALSQSMERKFVTSFPSVNMHSLCTTNADYILLSSSLLA